MKVDEVLHFKTKFCSLMLDGNGVWRYILPRRLNMLSIQKVFWIFIQGIRDMSMTGITKRVFIQRKRTRSAKWGILKGWIGSKIVFFHDENCYL